MEYAPIIFDAVTTGLEVGIIVGSIVGVLIYTISVAASRMHKKSINQVL